MHFAAITLVVFLTLQSTIWGASEIASPILYYKFSGLSSRVENQGLMSNDPTTTLLYNFQAENRTRELRGTLMSSRQPHGFRSENAVHGLKALGIHGNGFMSEITFSVASGINQRGSFCVFCIWNRQPSKDVSFCNGLDYGLVWEERKLVYYVRNSLSKHPCDRMVLTSIIPPQAPTTPGNIAGHYEMTIKLKFDGYVREIQINNLPRFKWEDVKEATDKAGRGDVSTWNSNQHLYVGTVVPTPYHNTVIMSQILFGTVQPLPKFIVDSIMKGREQIYHQHFTNMADLLQRKVPRMNKKLANKPQPSFSTPKNVSLAPCSLETSDWNTFIVSTNETIQTSLLCNRDKHMTVSPTAREESGGGGGTKYILPAIQDFRRCVSPNMPIQVTPKCSLSISYSKVHGGMDMSESTLSDARGETLLWYRHSPTSEITNEITKIVQIKSDVFISIKSSYPVTNSRREDQEMAAIEILHGIGSLLLIGNVTRCNFDPNTNRCSHHWTIHSTDCHLTSDPYIKGIHHFAITMIGASNSVHTLTIQTNLTFVSNHPFQHIAPPKKTQTTQENKRTSPYDLQINLFEDERRSIPYRKLAPGLQTVYFRFRLIPKDKIAPTSSSTCELENVMLQVKNVMLCILPPNVRLKPDSTCDSLGGQHHPLYETMNGHIEPIGPSRWQTKFNSGRRCPSMLEGSFIENLIDLAFINVTGDVIETPPIDSNFFGGGDDGYLRDFQTSMNGGFNWASADTVGGLSSGWVVDNTIFPGQVVPLYWNYIGYGVIFGVLVIVLIVIIMVMFGSVYLYKFIHDIHIITHHAIRKKVDKYRSESVWSDDDDDDEKDNPPFDKLSDTSSEEYSDGDDKKAQKKPLIKKKTKKTKNGEKDGDKKEKKSINIEKHRKGKKE